MSTSASSPSSTPEIITTAAEMRAWSRKQRLAGKRVGFVPTMGCLHAGHLSLVDLARSAEGGGADAVVVSIYVNPTQFAAHEDFGRYPRTREADRARLAERGVEAVFEPETLYGGKSDAANVVGAEEEGEGEGKSASSAEDSHDTFVVVERLSRGLCSLSRPHFFRGVATVVAKLFNIVEPDVAAFGEKDWQQLAVVRRMARDLCFPVEVLGGAVVREADGLALSSRNELLTAEDRERAPCIYAALLEAKNKVAAEAGATTTAGEVAALVKARVEAGGCSEVDYVSVVDADSLSTVPDETSISARKENGQRRTLVAVAAFFGAVRLIDNMVLC